ncbi:MAG: hypothetical protein KAG94_05440 [Clostridiales bacterium]|nr:hypothetical protein [Clostridiales bacterium]
MNDEKTNLKEEVNTEKAETTKDSRFKRFIKKNGFYLGIFLVFVLVIAVMSTDKDETYNGEIAYDGQIYYANGNQLYIQSDSKEAELLTANLLEEYNMTAVGKVLLMCKITEDESKLFFFENVKLIGETFYGDLLVRENKKTKTIEKDVLMSYALSSDYETIVYGKVVNVDNNNNILTIDLYSEKNGKATLIDSDVDGSCFTISGDGKTIYYNKGFYYETQTTSLFMSRDGINSVISNQAIYYYKLNANGTYQSNWPMTNTNGSKVIYATYSGENVMPALNMYQPDGQAKTILADSFAQIYADKELNIARITGDIRGSSFVGSLIEINLNSLEQEVITKDIWSMLSLQVMEYVDKEFLTLPFYFKNFNDLAGTADLYFKGENKDEEKVLPGVLLTDVKISEEYKEIYGLAYYYVSEGGELTKISNITDTSYETTLIDERVMEYHFDDANEVLGYRKDVKLYLIDKNGEQKMIDNHEVSAFDITANGKLIFFYKESGEIGKGDLYVMETDVNKDYKLVDKDVTFAYDFSGKYIAYINDYVFSEEAGPLIVTDGQDNFEILAPKVSTLLQKNTIK